MLANFRQQTITTSEANINTLIGGSESPLLLLHAYPQNYYMWHICDRAFPNNKSNKGLHHF